MNVKELCRAEGWEVIDSDNTIRVGERTYPLAHPYSVYLKIYRESRAPEEKLNAFKKVHDMLWPKMAATNNAWQDRIFKAHCDGWAQIVLAAGAGAGKSLGAAKVAIEFWLGNPTKRMVVISSTTLDSLQNRIWGYVIKLMEDMALPVPWKLVEGHSPKITFPGRKDKLHGMFAVAVKTGETERTISSIIGRHPEDGLMLILDEATDISSNIVQALANLEQGTPYFQLMAIGNSSSKNDLHGALATPREGWKSIDPNTHAEWPTCHERGICLYFNPWSSPAIHDPSPEKREILSQYLINKEKIEALEEKYGKDSDSYYRFVLGFWRAQAADQVLITVEFLRESGVFELAHWTGYHELIRVAGLDPAISQGKKGCVLRFAILGQEVSGKVVLDFRDTRFIHYIDITHGDERSSERQLAQKIVAILREMQCSLYSLALDASGLGRTLGDLLRLTMQSTYEPLRIVSSNADKLNEKNDNLMVIGPLECWQTIKKFIQQGQIRGLDEKTAQQLFNRRIIIDDKTRKEKLEPKKEYVARMLAINPALAHSPNEADAAILTLISAIQRHGFSLGQRKPLLDMAQPWQEKYMVFANERQATREMVERRKPTFGASFASPLEDVIWKKN